VIIIIFHQNWTTYLYKIVFKQIEENASGEENEGMKVKHFEIRSGNPPLTASQLTDSPAVEIWLTREQMATRLRVSVRTIDYWTEDGTLPVYKKGRVVRYDPGECSVALQAFRKKSRFEIREMSIGID
jgi:excisionase family DNA binding protein